MEVYEFETLKRRLAKNIMLYLLLHPDIMKLNGNSVAYDYARELRIQEAMKSNPNSDYADVAMIIDFMCEHELKKFPFDFRFEQEVIDCFKPDVKKDETYYRVLSKAILACKKLK